MSPRPCAAEPAGRRRCCAHRGRALAVLLLLLACCPLCPRSARAGQPTPEATASASTLFRAGAEAYAEENFLAALHAFGAARALVPDPALTFSIAQAHRRQYYLDGNARHLRRALAEYGRYVREVPKGGRRAEALEAIAELEPKLASLAEEAETAAPARVVTRLIVLSSVTGAQVLIDGGPAERAPFIGEVEPGSHQVRVEAPGYRPYVRSVALRPGVVLPVDANLEELPARLLVRGDEGATLWIDGRVVGDFPLAGPLSVPPGRRLVAVTRRGYRRYELETRLERGEHKEMTVTLESTAQRAGAITTLILGGGCLVAGGIFAGIAASLHGDAEDTYDRAQTQNIGSDELAEYDEARDDHQPWTVAAIASGAVGATLGLAGGLLFLFDTPPTPSQVAGDDPGPPRPQLAVGAGVGRGAATLEAVVRF